MSSKIVFKRVAEKTVCANECGRVLPLGAYAYVKVNQGVDEHAICPRCGVENGLSPDDLAKKMLSGITLDLEIKAMRNEKKILTTAIGMLGGRVNLLRLAELNQQAEHEMAKSNSTFQQALNEVLALWRDYMKNVGASDAEKNTVAKLTEIIDKMEVEQKKMREDYAETQRNVREFIEPRLFFFDESKKKKKSLQEEEELSATAQ